MLLAEGQSSTASASAIISRTFLRVLSLSTVLAMAESTTELRSSSFVRLMEIPRDSTVRILTFCAEFDWECHGFFLKLFSPCMTIHGSN